MTTVTEPPVGTRVPITIGQLKRFGVVLRRAAAALVFVAVVGFGAAIKWAVQS